MLSSSVKGPTRPELSAARRFLGHEAQAGSELPEKGIAVFCVYLTTTTISK